MHMYIHINNQHVYIPPHTHTTPSFNDGLHIADAAYIHAYAHTCMCTYTYIPTPVQVLRAHTAMLERRCAHYEVCMQGGEPPSFWPSSLGSSWAGATDGRTGHAHRCRQIDTDPKGKERTDTSSGYHARACVVYMCMYIYLQI
jgi:hypothetical protein